MAFNMNTQDSPVESQTSIDSEKKKQKKKKFHSIFQRSSRTPEIVSDAAHAILTRPAAECTGNFFIDDEVLAEEGITDVDRYNAGTGTPLVDLFLEGAYGPVDAG